MARGPNYRARVVGGGRKMAPRKAPAPAPEPAPEPQGPTREELLAMEQRRQGIIGRLERLAEDQVGKKTSIEQRWFEDLRQYHGRYDEQTERELRDPANRQSRLFANLTRPKTHAWEARLSDMLFPTDDKNWGIRPTPVPELIRKAEDNPDDSKEAKSARDTMADAKKASERMEAEIDDQLKECQYAIRCRDVIHDGLKLGTGVMKGPMTSNRVRRNWRPGQVMPDGSIEYTLHQGGDPRPEFDRTDPWNYFPDMSARRPEEKEFDFERHLYTKKDLRRLAKIEGFDQDALRQLIEEGPNKGVPNFISMLRDITAGVQSTAEDRYIVWEYDGPLETDEIRDICTCSGKDPEPYLEDVDPLTEINVIIWFCQGRLLKFGPHPLDSGDSRYSIFNFEKDDSSVFGYGIPFLMRDSQKALNGAWRMMMDNGGLSVGPQVVVDRSQIDPADGEWELTPRKVWIKKNATQAKQSPPFQVFNIPSAQNELANIITIARQFIDEETSVPLIATGEAGARAERPQGTGTMGGMAMLMNSVNVVFRRVVKNWDDDMTVPNIRKLYDWNMQFSSKTKIKGDYEVDARGSSVLLVREIQSQNLMLMATNFSVHPVLGPWTKVPSLYKKLCQALMLQPDDVMLSKQEFEEKQRKDKENAQPPPEIQLALAQLNKEIELGRINAGARIEVARVQQETQLMVMAEKHNITLDDLRAKLDIARDNNATKERLFAGEAAMAMRQQQRQGEDGELEPADQGGGYL